MNIISKRAPAVALAALIAVLSVSCKDPGTVSVELLAYDQELDDYAFQTVEITTLNDMEQLQGRATVLIGDANITLDYQKNELMRDDPGHFVAFGAYESDGVLIPEDFDSLAMVSAYYNVESAMLFFEELGMSRDLLVEMETYYWPDFTLIDESGEEQNMADNAFYMYVGATDRGFYVFPYEDFQWLPMAMNGGIMTHEFTHSVFDARVQDSNRQLIKDGMLLSGANLLYGLNEGIADYMAVARTGDPDYMEHSIARNTFGSQCNSNSYYEIVRDASIPFVYDSNMDEAARTIAADAFCPYDVGAFFASTLYSMAAWFDGFDDEPIPSRESRMIVARALYAALGDLEVSLGFDFEMWDIFNHLVNNLPEVEQREQACDILSERYSMYYSQIEACQ